MSNVVTGKKDWRTGRFPYVPAENKVDRRSFSYRDVVSSEELYRGARTKCRLSLLEQWVHRGETSVCPFSPYRAMALQGDDGQPRIFLDLAAVREGQPPHLSCRTNVGKNFLSPNSTDTESVHSITSVDKLWVRATFLSYRQDKVWVGPYPGFLCLHIWYMQIRGIVFWQTLQHANVLYAIKQLDDKSMLQFKKLYGKTTKMTKKNNFSCLHGGHLPLWM